MIFGKPLSCFVWPDLDWGRRYICAVGSVHFMVLSSTNQWYSAVDRWPDKYEAMAMTIATTTDTSRSPRMHACHSDDGFRDIFSSCCHENLPIYHLGFRLAAVTFWLNKSVRFLNGLLLLNWVVQLLVFSSFIKLSLCVVGWVQLLIF